MRYDFGLAFVVVVLLLAIFATLFPEDDEKPKGE